MHYAIEDREGNCPLLRTAQPLTKIERQRVRGKFIEQFNSGTLIIDTTPSENKQTFLSYHAHQKTTQFAEITSLDDNKYPLDLLCTSSTHFVKVFLDLEKNSKSFCSFCDHIANEIFSQFLNKKLDYPSSEFKDTFLKISIITDHMETLLIELKKLIPENKDAKYDDTLNTIINHAEKTSDQIFVSKFEKLCEYTKLNEKLKNEILTSCKTGLIVKYYLNCVLESKIKIGCSAILLYAQAVGIELYAYKKEQTTLTLNAHYLPGRNYKLNAIHLIFTNYLEFDLIIPVDQLTTNKESLEFVQLSIKRVISEDFENHKTGENLLHLASQSLAPDILLPIFLRRPKLKSMINNKDKNGSNPLISAIKFFAENRDTIIPELLGESVTFLQLARSCFSKLIEAGANLDLTDNYNFTAYKWAAQYESFFKTLEEPEFKIQLWLKSFMKPVENRHPIAKRITFFESNNSKSKPVQNAPRHKRKRKEEPPNLVCKQKETKKPKIPPKEKITFLFDSIRGIPTVKPAVIFKNNIYYQEYCKQLRESNSILLLMNDGHCKSLTK